MEYKNVKIPMPGQNGKKILIVFGIVCVVIIGFVIQSTHQDAKVVDGHGGIQTLDIVHKVDPNRKNTLVHPTEINDLVVRKPQPKFLVTILMHI